MFLIDWFKNTLHSKKKMKDILETEKDKELFEQLEAAFGEERALKAIEEIKRFKVLNQGRAFNFVFNELAQFRAIEKKKDLDNED